MGIQLHVTTKHNYLYNYLIFSFLGPGFVNNRIHVLLFPICVVWMLLGPVVSCTIWRGVYRWLSFRVFRCCIYINVFFGLQQRFQCREQCDDMFVTVWHCLARHRHVAWTMTVFITSLVDNCVEVRPFYCYLIWWRTRSVVRKKIGLIARGLPWYRWLSFDVVNLMAFLPITCNKKWLKCDEYLATLCLLSSNYS